jgi:hypothetical protein
MNAEQYRALVKKLEAITEAPVASFNQDASVTPAATDSGSSYTGSVGSATNDPVPAADPNQIPTIEAATFNQAYAQAAKQGLKKFKWTGTYAVKAQTSQVQTQPSTTQTKFQPPANVTAPGPNSTILKPGGGVDVNKLMTQQAAPANTNRPEFKPFR